VTFNHGVLGSSPSALTNQAFGNIDPPDENRRDEAAARLMRYGCPYSETKACVWNAEVGPG
jgi:hypothetical protein